MSLVSVVFIFWVFAVNAQELTVAGKPGFLNSVSGDGKLDLTWAHPSSNGGSMITGWEVVISSNQSNENYFLGGSSTAVTVSGLLNGRTYEIQVRAENSIGMGLFSDVIQSVPYLPLEAPQNLVIKVEDNRAVMQWSPPPSNGTPVTGYRIERSFYDETLLNFVGPSAQVDVGQATSYTSIELPINQKYKFKIYAIGPNGLSPDFATGVVDLVELEILEQVLQTTTTTSTTTTTTTTTTTPATTLLIPTPCTTLPNSIDAEKVDLFEDAIGREVDAVPVNEIDLRIPPNPVYVC